MTSEPKSDSSTGFTGLTPADSKSGPGSYQTFGTEELHSVSWPDFTYIITDTSGVAIALRDGKVCLTRPGSRDSGSIHWECVQKDGWLGFRNPISGTYLGHDKAGKLICSATQQKGWEHFCVRAMPGGGYVLLMKHWGELRPVSCILEQGVEALARVENNSTGGLVWRFTEV